jgi:hypothetical protein
MKILTSTDLSQRALIVQLADTTDISGETSFDLEFYTDTDGDAIMTYSLSESELAYFLANGIVYIPTIAAFDGATALNDGYYYCRLVGSSITSDWDSVVFTQTIRGQVYSKLAIVNIYSPDYDITTKLHVAKILLDTMEAMQSLEYSTRKKVDFTYRLTQLQTILGV